MALFMNDCTVKLWNVGADGVCLGGHVPVSLMVVGVQAIHPFSDRKKQ